MQDPFQQISAWIEQHIEQPITIQKEEDGDIDQVEMVLKYADVGQIEQHDADDYLADRTLLLHGHGMIRSGQQVADLPQGVYEIPFEGEWLVKPAVEQIQIETGRAIYTLGETQQEKDGSQM